MVKTISKLFFILLFFTFAAYGQQQERVAIINTMDNNDSIGFNELSHLTNRLRETAVKVLPSSRYGVMTTESIVAFLGSEEQAAKECREASCLAVLGRKVSADYVAQARIGRFGNQLSINFQLYNTKSGNLMDSFTGNANDIFGLLAIIDQEAPDLFRKMPGELDLGIMKKKLDYELDGSTEPSYYVPTPEVEKPIKTSFWVAIGLDVLGAAMIGIAVYENSEMNKAYKKYNRSWGSTEYYENAWKDVESGRKTRNVLYVVGGVFLASGIGVHIWF